MSLPVINPRFALGRRLDPRLDALDDAARAWNRPLVGPLPRLTDGLVDDSPLGWQDTPWWRGAGVRLVAFVVMLLGVDALIVWAVAPRAPQLADLGAELVSAVGAWWVVVRILEGRRVRLEWRLARWPGLLVGLGLGAGVCVLCFGVLMAVGVARVTGWNPAPPGFATWWTIGIVSGIAEELMLRGIVFRLAESVLGTWLAVAASGLLFGALHLGNPHATVVGALAIAVEAGLSLALLYALTRNLWVVIGTHAAWNLLEGPVLGLVVSGNTSRGDGLLVTDMTGPDLLTGGAFGLEASLVAVLVWSVVTWWAARALVRRGGVVDPFWVRHRRLPGALLGVGDVPSGDEGAQHS